MERVAVMADGEFITAPRNLAPIFGKAIVTEVDHEGEACGEKGYTLSCDSSDSSLALAHTFLARSVNSTPSR
jgi:hypothetical protein